MFPKNTYINNLIINNQELTYNKQYYEIFNTKK